jgi:methylmalonyl-CoA/ethylmalonyl-CoA epimerase
MFEKLDHIAIVVADTDAALQIWHGRLGLPVLFSEVVNDGSLRLTHLSLGNTQLQLVEPLVEGHPLYEWLAVRGPGLHHLCLQVDDIEAAMAGLPARGLAAGETGPHQGTLGRRALFLDRACTGGTRVELTGP